MTILISRLMLGISLVLSIALLVVRAQAEDSRSLTEILPANCEDSCFAGIQLGITTDEEALNLLKVSSWIDAKSVRLIPLDPSSSKFDDLGHIQWEWAINRPRLLATNPTSADGNINIRNHKVESIAFDTLLPAGAIYRLRGNPSGMEFMPTRNGEQWAIEWRYIYASAEFHWQMRVRPCPYLADLWLQPLHIFMSKRVLVQTTPTARVTPNINLHTILNARERQSCGTI
ncbi:MAG: hypothetical protein GC179_12560 [Anaerolineaceae bacterium]|nr:hypothetical protein [Anaerolineaceae bacterium]